MRGIQRLRLFQAALLTLALLAVPLAGQAKKRGTTAPTLSQPVSWTSTYDDPNRVMPKKLKEPWLKVAFTQTEAEIIRNYYSGQSYEKWRYEGKRSKKQKRLPPGLRKKLGRGGTLPPGWQKKVGRGEVLDLDVYRLSDPLPNELIRRLPPPPPGTVIIMLEGKIIRLLEATRTIADILKLKDFKF